MYITKVHPNRYKSTVFVTKSYETFNNETFLCFARTNSKYDTKALHRIVNTIKESNNVTYCHEDN